MPTISAIAAFLDDFAPLRLAADWDNVGLLVGDERQSVERIMTCLTVTPTSVAEAVREKAELIVTHHPLMFRPLKKITADETEGRMLLDLIAAGIAVYSPHTAFDSARSGINQRLAEGLGLADIAPLAPDQTDRTIGTGRFGFPLTPSTLGSIAACVKDFLNVAGVHIVGQLQTQIRSVAVACGSAGEMLEDAPRRLRLLCHRRSAISRLSRSRSTRHRPNLSGSLRQRTLRRGAIGRNDLGAISRRQDLASEERARPAALGLDCLSGRSLAIWANCPIKQILPIALDLSAR